eukprot:COSAG06_NODE_13054_length_1298_cov_1.295246_1_plen_185_part_00
MVLLHISRVLRPGSIGKRAICVLYGIRHCTFLVTSAWRSVFAAAAQGYAAVMLDFFGFSDIFMDRQHHMSQLGTYLLFYGLYFGVMCGFSLVHMDLGTGLSVTPQQPLKPLERWRRGRDFAEVCADRLASRMGYSNTDDRFASVGTTAFLVSFLVSALVFIDSIGCVTLIFSQLPDLRAQLGWL